MYRRTSIMIILSVLSIAVLAVLFFITGSKDGKTSHQVKGAAAVKTENSECFEFDPETLTYDGEGDLDLLEGVTFTDLTDPDAAGESSESGSGKGAAKRGQELRDIVFVRISAGTALYRKNIMVERGYLVESYNESHHDVYLKEPAYNFEMHKELMDRLVFPEFYTYFADVSERLIRNADKYYEYHFSNEDFYIYFICHAYRHYEYGGGTGLRTLADVFLLNRKFVMDRVYLKQEFKRLRVTQFEQDLRHLSEKVFNKHDMIYLSAEDTGLTYSERQMLEYIIGSGVFGTKDNIIRKQLVRDESSDNIHFRTRITYILHRIYPKGNAYRERYSFFYKHVWAYIFLPVYRLARRGNIKSLIREAMLAWKIR